MGLQHASFTQDFDTDSRVAERSGITGLLHKKGNLALLEIALYAIANCGNNRPRRNVGRADRFERGRNGGW